MKIFWSQARKPNYQVKKGRFTCRISETQRTEECFEFCQEQVGVRNVWELGIKNVASVL